MINYNLCAKIRVISDTVVSLLQKFVPIQQKCTRNNSESHLRYSANYTKSTQKEPSLLCTFGVESAIIAAELPAAEQGEVVDAGGAVFLYRHGGGYHHPARGLV